MLHFHRRFLSPIVQVSDYACCAPRHAPTTEEEATGNTIVLLRHGVFEKHFGSRRVTADLNQAVFFSKGSTYRVGHPTDCGDRGTVLVFSPGVLADLVRQFDPAVETRIDRPFPFVTGPTGAAVFAQHRSLLAMLAKRGPDGADPLRVEEVTLGLGAAVLGAAFSRHERQLPRQRAGTTQAHRELVEQTKTYLASRVSAPVAMSDVARGVHSSPFHLSRIFRERTGIPLHRYLLLLRLRTSVERIDQGAQDLAALALSLGFASHSHLTDAFRREFGITPSHFRRRASRGEQTRIRRHAGPVQ